MNIIKGKCVDISSEGKGVIKDSKNIYFVDGLFLNEEAEIEVLYSRAGVYYGKVHKLLSISKDRIEPKCKVCTSCGGCQYQQLDYKAQLELKRLRVVNAIKRIGKVDVNVLPTLGMKEPYYYRNKIQVPFSRDKKGKVIFGFYKQNSHEIILNKECVIEDKKASSILWDIKLLLEEMNISTYDEDKGIGILRHVLIRTSYHYPELMVVLVTTTLNFPGQHNFVTKLVSLHPEITTVVENVNSRHTNVILGDKEKVLYGPGYIKDDICDLSFKISASSFFQVNPIQVEVLYKSALSLLEDNKDQVILDAYSGVGTIGLIASKKVKEVISVENNKSAYKNAIENAKRNNITNIKFFCDDAGNFINNYKGRIDTVIMDPPRNGSDKLFLDSLINRKIKNIIYISCGPETLARDINCLSKYYKVTYVQPADMFPMTSHVETVVSLIYKG